MLNPIYPKPRKFVTKCPAGCGYDVYYHEDANGGRVFLDLPLGRPWVRHRETCPMTRVFYAREPLHIQEVRDDMDRLANGRVDCSVRTVSIKMKDMTIPARGVVLVPRSDGHYSLDAPLPRLLESMYDYGARYGNNSPILTRMDGVSEAPPGDSGLHLIWHAKGGCFFVGCEPD